MIEEKKDKGMSGKSLKKELEKKTVTEKIVEKVKEKEKKTKKKIPPKKTAARDIPCILRFKKVTAEQAANVARLFKKLNYTDYTISHSKGHEKWDIMVRFKSLDERDKFEERIKKLL